MRSMNKQKILDNVKEYSAGQLVEYIQEGIVTFDEIVQDTDGEFDPPKRREVKRLLENGDSEEEDGTITKPDGTVIKPDGTIIHPNCDAGKDGTINPPSVPMFSSTAAFYEFGKYKLNFTRNTGSK